MYNKNDVQNAMNKTEEKYKELKKLVTQKKHHKDAIVKVEEHLKELQSIHYLVFDPEHFYYYHVYAKEVFWYVAYTKKDLDKSLYLCMKSIHDELGSILEIIYTHVYDKEKQMYVKEE